MSVQPYRKKPVVIEALQWDGQNYAQALEFVGTALDAAWSVGGFCFIDTLEGRMNCAVGDGSGYGYGNGNGNGNGYGYGYGS